MNGLICRTEFQKASGVWPDSVRPEASVIVPEIITGRLAAQCLAHRGDRVERRLGVQRVEDRLDQDEVGTAFEQRMRRARIGGHEFVEADVAQARIVHIR